MEKKVLVKALRLQKLFESYATGKEKDTQQVREKFTQVWGKSIAEHFLWKYSDADSLIWALDSENLEKFIKNF